MLGITSLPRLSESARHASRWGRTDYGRAFREFQERHADALGPRASLLVLGDARSNYTDPRLDSLIVVPIDLREIDVESDAELQPSEWSTR